MCKEESDCAKDAFRGVSPLDVKGRCFAYRSLYSKGSCLSSKCCEGAQKRAFQLDATCKRRFGITVSGQCNVDLSKSSDTVSSEVCCKADTLACKACAAGVTEEKYCDNNPQESVCADVPCKRKADDSCTRDDRCELKRRVFFKTCVVKAANDPVKNEIACFKAAREQFKTSGFTQAGYDKLRVISQHAVALALWRRRRRTSRLKFQSKSPCPRHRRSVCNII